MNILIRSMMISCERSTQLTEKSLAFKLGWLDQKKLAIHTGMCAICKAYLIQSRVIDNVLLTYSKRSILSENTTLENEKLKERILSKL